MNKMLRQIRKQAGDTQKETANKLEISDVVYNRYETGKREIPVSLLKKFCKQYNTSSDYILGLSDQQQINNTAPQKTNQEQADQDRESN